MKKEPINIKEIFNLYKSLERSATEHLRTHLDFEVLEIRRFYRKAQRKIKQYWKENK